LFFAGYLFARHHGTSNPSQWDQYGASLSSLAAWFCLILSAEDKKSSSALRGTTSRRLLIRIAGMPPLLAKRYAVPRLMPSIFAVSSTVRTSRSVFWLLVFTFNSLILDDSHQYEL
jgi:hypothetical protein